MQLKKALVTELWYASKSANPPSASVVAASGWLPRTTSEVKWWPCWSTLADRCGVSSFVSSCADDMLCLRRGSRRKRRVWFPTPSSTTPRQLGSSRVSLSPDVLQGRQVDYSCRLPTRSMLRLDLRPDTDSHALIGTPRQSPHTATLHRRIHLRPVAKSTTSQYAKETQRALYAQLHILSGHFANLRNHFIRAQILAPRNKLTKRLVCTLLYDASDALHPTPQATDPEWPVT